MAALTFAAIDVGSFEVEMGIYEISNRNKIRKLDQIRHVTALGKDTYNNGKISYEMVEELCDVLADFARIMKSYKVTEYRAYATSAMREARNNRIVLDQIRVRTGIQVRIISNSEQRFLATRPSQCPMTSLMRISSREPRSWTWDSAVCRYPCLIKTCW